ncbi:MAG: carbohydrate kinase family protein [Lachnospiraceae bacterium]|nr:carbohydrate kinase family protein [Lachnospiraceae bacterium]MBQ3163347.1 carbohydrate kinase family protein [Lachnospiraceae bacterium]
MSRFMVAGFIQIETIVKVDELPVPYFQFCSVPDMIDTNVGGCGYNESMALTWLGNEVDFMSMVGKGLNTNKVYEQLVSSGVTLKMDYVLPRLESMPSSVILYHNGKKQTFEDVKDIRTVPYDYELFERQIQDKDMVLISSCNFCRPVIELAEKYHKPLAVNVRSMRKEKVVQKGDFLKAADILYISDDELDGDPYDCIRMCRKEFDPEIVIIGIGSKGVILYTKKDNSILEYKPVKTNEIVNTIGAGNALFSAFLHYYVKTGDAHDAIKNALLFASYKIGFLGTSNGFMTEEQIEQWKRLIWRR